MDSPTNYRPETASACTKGVLTHGRDVPAAKTALAVYLVLLVGFTALYTATAQRDVSWQDHAIFQHRILHRDYAGTMGLALAHPMYILMQQAVLRIAPAGCELWALNAFSGLGMAIALANLSLLVHRLTGRWWAGAGIALMLSVAHTAWWLSTIVETYTWSLAGLSVECLLLVSLIRQPRWATLAGLALVSGWGWSIHNLALLPLPVHLTVMVYLMIRRRLPVWSVLPAVAAFGLGAAMYIGMIVARASSAGLPEAVHSALFGGYRDDVFGVGTWAMVPYNLGLMALNGISLLPLLAVVGWLKFRRRLGGETALALAAITMIQVVFVVRYTVPDQFTFCLPALWMTGLAGGVGLAVLAETPGRWRTWAVAGVALSLVAGPAAYALLPRLVNAQSLPGRELKDFRDEVRYWAMPWKHNEHSADRFAQTVWRQMKPVCDAGNEPIILLGTTPLFPVVITQDMQRLCPRAQVQRDGRPLPLKRDAHAIRRAAGTRPIYVLSPQSIPRPLRAHVRAVKDHPDDVLYRLQWND